MKKMLLMVAMLCFLSWVYADDDEIEVIRCKKCDATPVLLMEEAQQFMNEVAKANEKGDVKTAEFMTKCCETKQKIANTMVYGDEEFTLAVDKFKKLIELKNADSKNDSATSDTPASWCPYCTYKKTIK